MHSLHGNTKEEVSEKMRWFLVMRSLHGNNNNNNNGHFYGA